MTNFTVRDAEELMPKRLLNKIIHDIANLEGDGYRVNEAFPTMRLGDDEVFYPRSRGLRSAMPGSSLVSESPVAGLESLEKEQVDVSTLKEKISPEKGLSAELSGNPSLLDVAEYVSDALMTDAMNARSLMAWRGYNNVDGMIGQDGLTAHTELDPTHIIKPNAEFRDTQNSHPYDVFQTAMEEVSIDGDTSGSVGPMTAYMSPTVYWDLKKNVNLQNRFTATNNPQSINNLAQLESVLGVDEIRLLETKIARTNDSGEPIDAQGNIVEVDNAQATYPLSPYASPSATEANRNIVLGHFGRDTAVMPWITDRLAAHIDGVPSGMWDVDQSMGMLLQGWTQHDPAISWRKIAQEIGFHIFRADNLSVIQDI